MITIAQLAVHERKAKPGRAGPTTRLRRRRARAAAAMTGLLAAATAGAAPSDRPDLVPMLPTEPSASQVAPVFVDAYEVPGRLLYRFDSVIWNRGGTLDLYRDPTTGEPMQVVWAGGKPSSAPDPDRLRLDAAAAVENRQSSGASFSYIDHVTHSHWHFAAAARYEFVVPDNGDRHSAKVGFCLADMLGERRYFRWGYKGSAGGTWCKPAHPGAAVRMGISPGAGDLYYSQAAWQWVDVTGLLPGEYALRASVNPSGYINESNTTNNVLESRRTIPGTIAPPVRTDVRADAPSEIRLSGIVVAPSIPARRSGACEPTRRSGECYVKASSSSPLSFRIQQAPSHGIAKLVSQKGATAVAAYAPDPGYSGPDEFTYTVRDVRRLESLPATVTLTVGGEPTEEPLPPAAPAPEEELPPPHAGAPSGSGEANASPEEAGLESESAAGPRLLLGSAKGELLRGNGGPDTIRAGGGNDVVRARAGDDLLFGARGRDRLYGELGRDELDGGPGFDLLYGGRGSDRLLARDRRHDHLYCGPGRDTAMADRRDFVARDCEIVLRKARGRT